MSRLRKMQRAMPGGRMVDRIAATLLEIANFPTSAGTLPEY
jgi:hypothetical protein